MPAWKNKKKKFHLQAKILLHGEDEDLKDRSKEASLFASGWIFVCPTAVSTDAYCDRASRCSRHGCFTRTFQVPPSSSYSSSFEVSFEADDSTRRNTTKRYELVQANLHSAVIHLDVYQSLFPTKLLAKTRWCGFKSLAGMHGWWRGVDGELCEILVPCVSVCICNAFE